MDFDKFEDFLERVLEVLPAIASIVIAVILFACLVKEMIVELL